MLNEINKFKEIRLMKPVLKRAVLAAAMVAVIISGVLAINLGLDRNVYVTRYRYSSDKIPEEFNGYKIAVISDVHNSKYFGRIIECLDRENADALIFAGDLIQLPDTDLDNVIKIVKAEREKSEILAVFGNHEASNGAAERRLIAGRLKENGVSVLMNSSADIERGGARLRLIGIEDVSDELIDDTELEKIKKITEKNASPDTCNILICHRASLYPYIKNLPVDLIISGHLHGGIIRLPFIGGVIGDAEKRILPRYTSGVYKEGDGTAEMIVSRGCDYNLKKMRFFNPPEIPVITLERGD